jgi:hypothetical protein
MYNIDVRNVIKRWTTNEVRQFANSFKKEPVWNTQRAMVFFN